VSLKGRKLVGAENFLPLPIRVKARDSHDRLYQIEIQLTSYGHLPARIIYNWADIYSQQLKSGQYYLQLRPTGASATWGSD
jgi:predicted transposase/invertase (TIGR01784 family)